MEQRTMEWFLARRGRITASPVGCLMAPRGLGKLAETYAKSLVADQISEFFEDDQFTSYAMQQGIDLEPMARDAYALEELVEVQEVGFITKGDDLGCSPDGLVDDDGGLEIKCPQPAKHMDNLLSEFCPKEYIDQVQFSLLVTDREYWDVMTFNPTFKEGYRFKIWRVTPDDIWQIKFYERLADFKELMMKYKDIIGIKE